jgi:hypothetical protein
VAFSFFLKLAMNSEIFMGLAFVANWGRILGAVPIEKKSITFYRRPPKEGLCYNLLIAEA